MISSPGPFSPKGPFAMTPFLNKNQRERGSVAPMVLGLMAVMTVVGLSVVSLTQTAFRTSADNGRRLEAMHLADAGLDKVIWRLQNDPHWRDITQEQGVSLGTGQYFITSVKESGPGLAGFTIEAWVPGKPAASATNAEKNNAVHVQVYAEVAPVYLKPWAGAALGDRAVPVANGDTDSYRSSEGPYGVGPIYKNGDVATNSTTPGAITIGSNGSIQGNVFYPQGASSSVVDNDGTVTGSIAPNPAETEFVVLPPPPATAITIQPVNNGQFVTQSGILIPQPIPPGHYIIKSSSGKSISLSGNQTLIFSGVAQTVLYLEGDASIGGNGISNAGAIPGNLILYGMPTCDTIDISGNGNFHGAVYAPEAEITLNGGGSRGEVFGSLAGREVSFNGNGTIIHYDESLRDLPGVVSRYRLSKWTQIR